MILFGGEKKDELAQVRLDYHKHSKCVVLKKSYGRWLANADSSITASVPW